MSVEMRGVEERATSPEMLEVTAEYASVDPATLFRFWTQPELLTAWWPQRAEVDLRVTGSFHFWWPDMDLHLRGVYSDIEPGSRLGFSWYWDHEPSVPARFVDVLFELTGNGGTRITVTHQRYEESARDREERQGHLEGWTYFLGRLQSVTGDVSATYLLGGE
jgi:uncharacterized protein YndB with AHSA1/START domain